MRRMLSKEGQEIIDEQISALDAQRKGEENVIMGQEKAISNPVWAETSVSLGVSTALNGNRMSGRL